MKRLILLFLSIFCLFALSCNYNVLGPNIDNSNSSNNGNSGNESNNDNNSGTIKTMYFKFKVSGKSSRTAFNKNNIFPKELSIKNYDNDSTFTHTGNWGDPGYILNYLFCDDKMGNSMSMPFYAGDSKLKVSYNDKYGEVTFKGYIWIGNTGTLFFRNNFSCTISLKDFDESKYNNTALISIILYPDTDTYTFTLDGFESK